MMKITYCNNHIFVTLHDQNNLWQQSQLLKKMQKLKMNKKVCKILDCIQCLNYKKNFKQMKTYFIVQNRNLFITMLQVLVDVGVQHQLGSRYCHLKFLTWKTSGILNISTTTKKIVFCFLSTKINLLV